MGKITGSSLLALLLTTALSGCEEDKVAVGISAYNHTKDRSVYIFTVNGAMGPNVGPESGGGKQSCCVSLPAKWRPGLKAKIEWRYQGGTAIPPPPPPQEAEVELPEYKKPEKLQVHFYDNHKIKLVISSCSIGHPFYPMSDEDKLPWEASGTKEEALDSQKRGVMKNDC